MAINNVMFYSPWPFSSPATSPDHATGNQSVPLSQAHSVKAWKLEVLEVLEERFVTGKLQIYFNLVYIYGLVLDYSQLCIDLKLPECVSNILTWMTSSDMLCC